MEIHNTLRAGWRLEILLFAVTAVLLSGGFLLLPPHVDTTHRADRDPYQLGPDTTVRVRYQRTWETPVPGDQPFKVELRLDEQGRTTVTVWPTAASEGVTHQGTLGRERVAELVSLFRECAFFELEESQRNLDLPATATELVELEMGSRQNRIRQAPDLWVASHTETVARILALLRQMADDTVLQTERPE